MDLDILAIGAHPDDVELACGGTLAKAVRMGYRVGILDLTGGELGTRGSREIREKEAAKAANVLGVHVRENLRLPDGSFEVNQKNRLKLIQVIRHHRPKIIIIPHWQERHPDHVHAHVLAKEAWFYSGLQKIATTYRGKRQLPWRPQNYFHFMQWYEFTPSFIIDISEVHEIRREAIRSYVSQFYNPKSLEPETVLSQQNFFDFLESRAKHFGQKIGVRYGEPFYSIEAIGIRDMLTLQMFKG